ncbi:MAG: hypothetical protein EXR65_01310 [Dehalococcoidia bacterium]|nr:hypothetical protein [Dehalococcoidia bacterium]
MSAPLSLVVMLGGMDGGPLETLLRRALEASALDGIEAALATGRFERALLLADRVPSLPVPAGTIVDLDPPGTTFSYGGRLAGAVAAHGIERLLYLGGGSAPLLGREQFEALADGVAGDVAGGAPGEPVCVTNNFYSADLFALAPAALLARLDPAPGADNAVPRRLHEELGVAVSELPRSLATQLNLDSPVDLAALALAGSAGPRLGALLAGWAPPTERLASAARAFTDREAEVLVAGRVSSRSWQYLERETACRVRVLAEERGMGAAGRDSGGEARSLLGQLIAAVGPARFFRELLPELCDAAFIDTRPALVQLGLAPSRADRFASDLGLVGEIADRGLRTLTEEAAAASVPVVLGGHSLVAGVLMLLNDWAWGERERASGA